MRATQRRIDPGVARQLLAEPHRFGFFQAMRVLEQLFHRQGDRTDDAIAQRVRFRNSLSLGFAAGELEAAQAWSEEGEPLEHLAALDHALATESVGRVELTPAFMGLLGTSGALPLHYTEMLHEREVYQRDRAARAFLDIFTTRAVALHYGAWKKYRLALQYELDRRERFLPLVLSLAGVGLPGLRDRMADGQGDVFDQAIAYHAGGVRQRPVSAAFLARMLTDYFGIDIEVEQFVGAWYRVPEQQTTRLGMANARLGADALAGDRVWQRDLRLRLLIGPLARERFDAFLPGGDAARALAKWLTLLTGSCLEYEVRLLLRAEDVRGAGIGGGHGARLGWDSYVCTRPSPVPRSDAGYGIHTLQ
ncbi:type VI secretion system baseplate subunit TssG [Luteimonas sp. SJ-92]|uniref:Type VI secretion system baseplate subunit TssG n=1 Tax=Luteimonas salinisoli TaxID=2752307 RepID=A0A853JFM7_9GAMM|nr:type VI secretion system baseplate subunit TssG [Luteimonas salinisoli]NZA28136.1 type VI secretion system baseplate subunit TssG [Luteimonas salinisoli]